MNENDFNSDDETEDSLSEDFRPTELLENCSEDNDLPWICSNYVKADSVISVFQVEYALSELTKTYSVKSVLKFLSKQEEFLTLLKEDCLERLYLIYSDYRQWALKNRKKIKLKAKRRKEIDLCLLGL